MLSLKLVSYFSHKTTQCAKITHSLVVLVSFFHCNLQIVLAGMSNLRLTGGIYVKHSVMVRNRVASELYMTVLC